MKSPTLIIGLLLAHLSLSQAQFDIRLGFATPELDGVLSEEQFLNQVIGDELDSLDRDEPCSRRTSDHDDPDSIARRMDRLAERLSMAMDVAGENGEKLRKELADAVGLDDILQSGYGQDDGSAMAQPQTLYRSDLRTRAPDEILEADNRFIYHGKRLADQAIMQLANDMTKRALTDKQRLFSEQMFEYADEIAKKDPLIRIEEVKRKLMGIARVGAKAVEAAYDWADMLYVGSDFLDNIPILGVGIQQLRDAGRRTYEIMDTVRYMHRLWSKVKEELPNGDSHTRQVLGSENTKRMLTNSGLRAVRMIAAKLLTAGVSSMADLAKEQAAIAEMASRCAYYLFSQLVPRSSYCLIGRGIDRAQIEELLKAEE